MLNCPKCNSFVREGQKFCTKCGMNLDDASKVLREKRKDTTNLAIVISVSVVFIVLAISAITFLFITNARKGYAPVRPKTKASSSAPTRPARPSRPRSEKLSSSERIAEKARRRSERERRRDERKRRTETELPSKEIGYVLKGIFVDEMDERYAIIGERRAKRGDMVMGRRIQEIETDRVKVEYYGSIYEVRIGHALF